MKTIHLLMLIIGAMLIMFGTVSNVCSVGSGRDCVLAGIAMLVICGGCVFFDSENFY